MEFKEDFLWGVATSSTQTEGAHDRDGKGVSIWDSASIDAQHIVGGHTVFDACGHYDRMESDIELLSKLGLNAYRFSINWCRLFPEGVGRVNEKGVAFYDRMIDSLLQRNIRPCICLHHWDYPEALMEKGGWLNPDSASWYADYASTVAKRYGDRVDMFMSANEPECFIDGGYAAGALAPFLRYDMARVLRCAHHFLMGNGMAISAIRSDAKLPVKIGMANVSSIRMPKVEEDLELARQMTFQGRGDSLFTNSFFYDPVIFGAYPSDVLRGMSVPFEPHPDDMKVICQPLDFIGANIYQGEYIERDEHGNGRVCAPDRNIPRTAMDWLYTPECLYYGPKFLYERYKFPLIVSENGVGLSEWRNTDGNILDDCRCEYIRAHLQQLKRCIREGAQIDGYYYWTLFDNFEWTNGYTKKFGLVHVDYDTMLRTPKKSFDYYKHIIKTNGSEI